jgi:DNA-binding MarR family transcriptional regulator
MSRAGGTPTDEVDRLWLILVGLVMDTRGDWRRKVAEATGLPFSRVRALRRLGRQPMSLGELAEAMGSDAPAATVAVNDLERRGLVVREPHPEDRRAKLVSLTAGGRRTLALGKKVKEGAPAAFAALTSRDVDDLKRILERVSANAPQGRRATQTK